jgi:hypothetical protein
MCGESLNGKTLSLAFKPKVVIWRLPMKLLRSGFIALALEKNQRATPLIAEARTLKNYCPNRKQS